MNRPDQNRADAIRRVARAARAPLAAGRGVTSELIRDVCDQVGIHHHGFRTLFPTKDALLDAVNDDLVQECSSRLRHGVDQFFPVGSDDEVFEEAALALARAWPLDRAGLVIRASRRLSALEDTASGLAAIAGERRFASELLDIFTTLMHRLDREFSWPPALAVRVFLDTYERSFEAWILEGNDEIAFDESPYVSRTLPTLIKGMSQPRSPGQR